MPSFEGNLFTQRHQITSLETSDSRLNGENPESYLSHGLDSVPGHDRQMDRIMIANMQHLAVPAVASKKHHII